MQTIEHLRELYLYNDWANRRLIVHLKSNKSEKARRLLAHLLITEKEYYERLYGKNSTGFDFWQDLTLAECGNLAKEAAELYERLLKNFDDEGLAQIVLYYTSEGKAVKNSFREMLTHVLFHSTHHRGQILTVLRQEDYGVPVLDYIIYCREAK